VVGKIIQQGKDKKILVFKSKRRKNSRKLNGHRQYRTVLKIEKINS
jgi:large subunit ribosomal protein L21